MSLPSDFWIGAITGLLFLLVPTPPIARYVARLDSDPRMFRLVMWAAALRLAAAPLYIYVIDHYYGGAADAFRYSNAGTSLARQIAQGNFDFSGVGKIVGDGFTTIATGFVYVAVGSNQIAGFMFFAFAAFVGLVLFYLAFRTALPDADGWRYARLIFFVPSLVFWASAVGKDSFLVLTLGIAALGGARVLARQRGGFVLLGVGLTGTALVRPHLALIMFAALAVAYPVRASRSSSPLNPVSKAFGVVALIVGGLVLAKATSKFFGIQSLNPTSVQHVLNQNAYNTGTAARNQLGQFSSSQSTSVSLSPLSLPRATYDVIIRPLPFKAHGLTQLVSSFENTFIVLLFVASWRRVRSALASIRTNPYYLAAIAFSLTWIILFASIGNLGILARERTSMLPMLLVLVCAAPSHRPGRRFETEPRGSDGERRAAGYTRVPGVSPP